MITERQIQGHWVREWIKGPGFEDHTTRVNWIQVGMDYADIRVPLDRPDLDGVACLAELAPECLVQLADAEGFAGHVTLDGTHCTWHREINWHGVPDGRDIGALRFDETGAMIEEGVEADYAELWHARAEAPGRAIRFTGSGYLGLLLISGSAFVLGIGRPDAPPTRELVQALRIGQVPTDIAALFDGFHAYGFWTGTEAVARLATHPFAESRIVASLFEDRLIWRKIGFDGTVTEISMSVRARPAHVVT